MPAEGRQGVPTAVDLAAALRGFLEDEVVPETEGHLSYMARVAAKVAASLERELALGPELARAQEARLAALGVAGEAELAEAIRAGRFDDRLPEVVEVLYPGAIERLRIWNPRYLRGEDAAAGQG